LTREELIQRINETSSDLITEIGFSNRIEIETKLTYFLSTVCEVSWFYKFERSDLSKYENINESVVFHSDVVKIRGFPLRLNAYLSPNKESGEIDFGAFLDEAFTKTLNGN
jgi:hypothetical protein